MPNSTRSNKDKRLLFSEDPAHLERTIRKDQRSTSLDAAAFTSTDSHTQPSTDTRPSSSTDLHPSTSIDTTPRHRSIISRETWLRLLFSNKTRMETYDDFWQVVKHKKLGEGDFEVESSMSFSGSLCAVRIMTHEEFAEKQSHPPSLFYVKIDRRQEPAVDRQRETDINRPSSPPIDQRVFLTYRVRLPSIDSDRINALRPPPKPLANQPEPTTNPSERFI
ncbi:hypothetical protein F2Q69_00030665 [Brassica cretica]|uniref:Uncharacterized protein n=1 Tax=Brassica cretica TaxID=69181 RepID=A0A8S9S3Q0_BRACR|nr:hypothetical protein F2Q69_00030665 [Brassica cretica]